MIIIITIAHQAQTPCCELLVEKDNLDIALWFVEGKTSLLQKPGEFSSENDRPITCLNMIYYLRQGEQRGVKENCNGTIDNLLIDRIVFQDSQRGKKNLIMAWVDIPKAYDSLDHR